MSLFVLIHMNVQCYEFPLSTALAAPLRWLCGVFVLLQCGVVSSFLSSFFFMAWVN